MEEGEEFYFPEEETEFIELMPSEYANKNLYWETQGGKRILVQDMEESHILNTIAMIRRSKIKSYENGMWIFVFEHELLKRKLNI
jgi:hypothetical protein